MGKVRRVRPNSGKKVPCVYPTRGHPRSNFPTRGHVPRLTYHSIAFWSLAVIAGARSSTSYRATALHSDSNSDKAAFEEISKVAPCLSLSLSSSLSLSLPRLPTNYQDGPSCQRQRALIEAADVGFEACASEIRQALRHGPPQGRAGRLGSQCRCEPARCSF